jgi:hypothetical protein
MPDLPTSIRLKSGMLQSARLSISAERRQLTANRARRAAGVFALLLLCVLGFRWLFSSNRGDATPAAPRPRIDVPLAVRDGSPSIPLATEAEPKIATIREMAKPWSAKQFFYQDRKTGENVPALLIRLPIGSAAHAGGYWALSMNAPYGDCKLEYVADLAELQDEYQFQATKHPVVGNPCNRAVFDPLKLAKLQGNVWVRGAIAQGSDLRPPLGIEIRVRGKDILAIRME